MKGSISKSQFKPRALELMREVENTGKELTITDRGRPVLKIVPYSQKPSDILRNLRGTVLKYDDPTDQEGVELGLRKQFEDCNGDADCANNDTEYFNQEIF